MAMSSVKNKLFSQVSKNLKYLSYPLSTAVSKVSDTKVTHTGQKFDDNDPRMVRFIDREKQVNPHFAIDLINSIPPEVVKERVVSCDGGGGPLGHPKVYINLDQPGPKACGYCGLQFKLEDHH